MISLVVVILFTVTIISLIIENNFYTKNNNLEEKINIYNENRSIETINKTVEIETVEQLEKPLEIINKTVEIETIEQLEENKTKKVSSNKEKKFEISDLEAEKILQEKINQVKENSNTNSSNESIEDTPEIIGLILAKIISDENLDAQNITLESFEERTWNSSALGCPVNGMFYAQVITDGYKLNVIKNNEKEEYHTDLRTNYINCTQIRKSNINANFNFVEKYELSNTKRIELRLNKEEKLISTIENEERINSIINSINKKITISQSDICEANYKLIFEKEDSSIEMLVYCNKNPYYVYVDESITSGNTILSIVEEILSTIEFPGMPK